MSLIQTIVAYPNAFIARVKDEFDLSEDTVAELYDRRLHVGFTLDDEQVHIRSVYREGGGEGEGEYVERVLSISLGDEEVFLRTTGFYSSYSGTDWSGEWVQVFPQAVTVVRYAEAGKQASV